jgi:branched-chain amino acid transport system ATP-binding protein
MDKILELVDVHTYYGESHILQGVSMHSTEGSVVALLGRNGMGKTTLIRSIIGFTPPRRGRVYFKGRDITGLKSNKIAKMGIGLFPQGRRIFPSLSVKENLIMSARNAEKPEAWSLEKVYSLFPVLEERSHYRGTLLSGGEQSMLAISRALMCNPDLLVMDEPSEGLAPIIVQELGRVISQLKRAGFSILVVEQNLPLALKVASYVYILSKGSIVYESDPDDLRGNEEVKRKFLGVAR